MSTPSYKIGELLNKPETQLAKLIEQAESITNLNKTFLSLLSPEYVPHCHISHYSSGVLTVFTDNAAWATRLRYSVPTLLSELRKIPQWAGICSIQVKVQTLQKVEPPKLVDILPRPQKPTEKNVKQFISLANILKGQPGFEALVKSLEKLATHQGTEKDGSVP